MDVPTVLLIILSIGFAVLLILSITLAFILVKILSTVRRITLKAEEATDSIGAAAISVAKKVAPLAVSTAVGAVLKKARKHKKGGAHE